jgi:cobalt-zinc-cadmium efflux system outer membrane protein
MSPLFRIATFTILVCLPASGLAQDSPVEASAEAGTSADLHRQALTLPAALREALSANPELKALRSEFEAARAAPVQERFLAAPMFETQIWGWPVTTLNPARTDMYMFMGEQEIPGRGKRALRAAVGEREADVAQQRVLVRANEILDEVRHVHADLMLARETLPLLDEQADILRSIADAATVRYTAARAGQQDTVRALLELTRLDTERIEWRARARDAETRLNTLLGRPVAAPIESLAHDFVPDVSIANLELVALERHPEVAMARADMAREHAELARIQGDRRPDFVVGGGYMLQPGGAGAWTARAGVSWPNAPWSRSRLNAAIDAQERRVLAAKARVEAAESVVRRSVQQAVIRFESARQRVQLLETTVLPQVRHAFELSRVAYTADRGGFGDLIDAQRAMVAARAQIAMAETDEHHAFSEIERAVGGLTGSPLREETP